MMGSQQEMAPYIIQQNSFIMQDLIERIFTIQERFGFKCFEVVTEAELPSVMAPAIAFVRETGFFYFMTDHWVKSIGDNIFRSTRIEYIPQEATQALSDLIVMGSSTPGFWSRATQLWYYIHNPQLAELNECTLGTSGAPLYTFSDGDLVVESLSKSWCVRKKDKDSTISYYGRNANYIGQRPLIVGTPGLHIQKARERITLVDSHTERLGNIVNKYTIPKGARSFEAAVYPDSLPRILIGGGVSWNSTSQTDGIPDPHIYPPEGKQKWHLNKFAWLQSPDQSVELQVTNFVPPRAGVMPECLNATITLEQACPIPLIFGGTIYTKSDKTWFVSPPDRSFGWMPTGIYGSGFNQDQLSIRVRGRSWEHIDNGAKDGAPIGTRQIKPYASWIQWAGKRRFSRLRGLRTTDLLSISNYNRLYDIQEILSNNLDNPYQITLSTPILHAIEDGSPNIDGIWLSKSHLHWVCGELPENPYTAFIGWQTPDNKISIPLVVDYINFNTVNLIAPVAKDIPAGTIMPIWLSADLDSVTYAYYDYHEFHHQLEQWVEYSEKIKRDTVVAKLSELNNLKLQLQASLDTARILAQQYWFQPPYYVNRQLDDWLPDEYLKYGSTYASAMNRVDELYTEIANLLTIKPPSWNSIEYMSILRYSHNGIGA